MAIYIDSAIVRGGGGRTVPWLGARCDDQPGPAGKSWREGRSGTRGDWPVWISDPLFYQLVSPTLDGMRARNGARSRNCGAGAGFEDPSHPDRIPICQSMCRLSMLCNCRLQPGPGPDRIAKSRARYVAVYVNRATRLMGDGFKLVREVAEILKHSSTEIIAASIKSSEEACASLAAGAHHLALPYEVLTGLIMHPLSEQAMAEFQDNGVGISHPAKRTDHHVHAKPKKDNNNG